MSSCLDCLSIRGIRSFGDDSAELITFAKPLTVIVGANGCGKTTLIECLKYACTGELPPGTAAGQSFVHDPKIAGKSEVKGQIKVRAARERLAPRTWRRRARAGRSGRRRRRRPDIRATHSAPRTRPAAVRAQVKFKNRIGQTMVCVRDVQLVQARSKMTFKALGASSCARRPQPYGTRAPRARATRRPRLPALADSVIMTYKWSEDMSVKEKVSITHKCSEMDKLMPECVRRQRARACTLLLPLSLSLSLSLSRAREALHRPIIIPRPA